MKGQILDYSVQTNSGAITGADGSRYPFAGSEWKGASHPTRGAHVDFDAREGTAIAVYEALGSTASHVTPTGSSGKKSRVTAGLLAFFLGYLGIHKFYLGFNGTGLLILLTNTVGLFFTWMLFFIPNIALYIIQFIEAILYFTKTDEEFEQRYTVEKKNWF